MGSKPRIGRTAPAVGPSTGGARVGQGFILGYTLAQIGAFIAFVPLLNVLLPLKALTLAPTSSSLLVSHAALWGAVAASVSHLTTGLLSDGTQSRLGRRRPWIIIGVLATVASYGGVFLARTPLELIAAIVVFQVAFNIMFSPLTAVFADQVPDANKGLVSAFTGLAYPAASLFAALVVAVALTGDLSRYAAVAVAVFVLVIPFALWSAREPAVAMRTPIKPGQALVAFRDRDFLLAFIARLLVQTAISLNSLYFLFYLKDEAEIAARLPHIKIDALLGWVMAASTGVALVSGFAAGIASDRAGRRKVFVSLGGLAICAGAAILAFAPAWPGPLIGQVVYGLGLGVFCTIDLALIAEVLPARASVGRDLGVMNIASTLPQVIAPLAGVVLLTGSGWSLLTIFATSAGFALLGSLLVLLIRRTR